MTKFSKKNLLSSVKRLILLGILGLFLLALRLSQCFAEKSLTDEEFQALREKPNKKAEDFLILNRERKYRAFRPIESFIQQVFLAGSADKLMEGQGLDDYLRLRFVNDLKDYTKDSNHFGFFVCQVWTVSDKYPIAMHIKCEASLFTETETWSSEILGISTESTIKGTVKKALSDMVEEFAVFFLKAKGVL